MSQYYSTCCVCALLRGKAKIICLIWSLHLICQWNKPVLFFIYQYENSASYHPYQSWYHSDRLHFPCILTAGQSNKPTIWWQCLEETSMSQLTCFKSPQHVVIWRKEWIAFILRSAQSAAATEQSAGGWSTVKVATWPSEEAESLADFNFGNDIRSKARIPVYVYRSDSSILSAWGMRERKEAINRTTGVRRLEQFGKEGERFHLDKTYRCLRWSSMIRSCTFSW